MVLSGEVKVRGGEAGKENSGGMSLQASLPCPGLLCD